MEDHERSSSGQTSSHGEDEPSATLPKSPIGSTKSQCSSSPPPHRSGSSSSNSSSGSSKRSGSSRLGKYHQCQKKCHTVVVCLLVGVTISLGSVAMTVCGYFALNIASHSVESGNTTVVVKNQGLFNNLFKFRTFGPVMIGFGGFLIMCACVLLCEASDKKKKRTGGINANENLLTDHERVMDGAREPYYKQNRTTVLVESQTANYMSSRTPNEYTTCLDSEIDVDATQIATTNALDSNLHATSRPSLLPESPVVLVHGPNSNSEPTHSAPHVTTTDADTVLDTDPLSNSPLPPKQSGGTPSRGPTNSDPGTCNIDSNLDSNVCEAILPQLGSPLKKRNEISCAGGAIPKSILVSPKKLSPVRNGPIRVRLNDSPVGELSPTISPSITSKSTECLSTSPGSTPSRRVRRGKKKKTNEGGLQVGTIGSQCRCLSDPSMASSPSPCPQSDACCYVQQDCCWKAECKMAEPADNISMRTTRTEAGEGPASDSRVPECTNANASQSAAAAVDNQGSRRGGELLNPETAESPPGDDPRQQTTDGDDCPSHGGIVNNESNADTLVLRDNNSNITVSSARQEQTPVEKSAPYGGQSQGGVMV